MIIELIIGILIALTLVNLSYYYMRPDLVATCISQVQTNEHWRAVLLGMFQSSLGFSSPGVSYFSISDLLAFKSNALMLTLVWFIVGIVIGLKSKNWKQAIILGLLTPLSQSQLYIMMLQQYTPSVWQSFSSTMQQEITYAVYTHGLIFGVFMAIGLLIPTVYHMHKERKKAKVTYSIPKEKLLKYEIKCPQCGEIHFSNAKYCSNCGAQLYKNDIPNSEVPINEP